MPVPDGAAGLAGVLDPRRGLRARLVARRVWGEGCGGGLLSGCGGGEAERGGNGQKTAHVRWDEAGGAGVAERVCPLRSGAFVESIPCLRTRGPIPAGKAGFSTPHARKAARAPVEMTIFVPRRKAGFSLHTLRKIARGTVGRTVCSVGAEGGAPLPTCETLRVLRRSDRVSQERAVEALPSRRPRVPVRGRGWVRECRA